MKSYIKALSYCMTISSILGLSLGSCKTTGARVSGAPSKLKDAAGPSFESASLVHFPISFTDGRKILFRSMTQLSGDDEITSENGSTGADTIRMITFKREKETLKAFDVATKKTLFQFKIEAQDDASIAVDFNQGFSEFEADDAERDQAGNAILNSSSGYPNPITKNYMAVEGSLKVSESLSGESLFVSQILKLKATKIDKFSVPSAVSKIDYSFLPAKPQSPFPILKITSPEAQAQFNVDEHTELALRINPGNPLLLNMEQGTPASVKEGVKAGMAYWNKIMGKAIFSLGEDQPLADNFYKQNIVRIVPFSIKGAGSIPQTFPDTGMLTLPGYELQFPHEFFDDLKVSTEADTLMRSMAAYLTAHELGHVLGFQHNFAKIANTECASVMCYTDDTFSIGSKIDQGILDLDYDKKAIDYLYGSQKSKKLPEPFEADKRN